MNKMTQFFERYFAETIATAIILFGALVGTFRSYKEREKHTCMYYLTSFVTNIFAGIMTLIVVSLFMDVDKWLWLGAGLGTWGGAKILTSLSDAFYSKFSQLINKKDD